LQSNDQLPYIYNTCLLLFLYSVRVKKQRTIMMVATVEVLFTLFGNAHGLCFRFFLSQSSGNATTPLLTVLETKRSDCRLSLQQGAWVFVY